MYILGIETSCDETGASIIYAQKGDKKVKLISSTLASSLTLHAETGGIIPETAARQQIRYILPVIDKTIKESNLNFKNIDAIAVTVGPGLIGSLLIGVETAKTLAFVFDKPIIPVNHLVGHIYANFINSKQSDIKFPAIVLIVSGGHTDLLLMKNHGDLKWLGGTRDDAAGEAFDKIGRILKLPYPGGPAIEKAARNGNSKAFNFPRPMINLENLDFSFSGLKTAVAREIQTIKQLDQKTISDLSASVQQAIIDVLVEKTLKAVKEYKVKSIILSGGVSANQKLREQFESEIKKIKLKTKFFAPEKNFSTDNAVMIATAAFFNYKPILFEKITANPELYFD